MTAGQMADPAAARAFFVFIRDLRWNWRSEELPGVIERLGWPITSEVPNGALTAIPSWGIDSARAIISRLDGEVFLMAVDLTDKALPSVPGRVDFLQDAFVEMHAVAVTALGPPDERLPGDTPTSIWHMGPTTVQLSRRSVTVNLEWSSTVEYERQKEYAERMAEQGEDG